MGFNKVTFAANLRAARAALDMSQEDLAQKTGISKDAIVKYESGDGYTPGADKVIALCRVVKKSPNELMGWKEI